MTKPAILQCLGITRLLIVLMMVIGVRTANAKLLLYEPFDYGNFNTNLIAVSGPALGLDGMNYTVYAASTYVPAGMTFGDLLVSGGYGYLAYYNSSQANTRGLDINIPTGRTLYGGFLHAAAGGVQNSTGALLFGTSTCTDQTANFSIIGCWYGTTCQYTGLSAGTRSIKSSGVALTLNNPVLVLFRVTNMGASSGTQTVSLWVLDEAQLAYHRDAGLTASNLDTASTGSDANQILQTAQLTISVAPYITMTDTMFMRPFLYRCGYSLDEIRLSNASLDEAAPGPPRRTLISIR